MQMAFHTLVKQGDGEHDSAGMGDYDASHSSQDSLSIERSCEAVHQSGVSFSSRSCHESVRVVIPDGIIDKGEHAAAVVAVLSTEHVLIMM